MSLMGSLWTGVSGLQTSNNALNTTAHNMSNMDTVGYTRQQVSQGTRPYVTIEKNNKTNWKQLGLGVNYTLTRQERDYFLDKNYRRESGRSAFYDVSTSTMEEIEYILGESESGGSIEGHEFSESLSNLWVAIQELSKDPTSSVNQNLFVTRSYEFITRASAVYTSLCQYQDNLNYNIGSNMGYNQSSYQNMDTSPMSMGDWLLTILAAMIPCAGLILYLVWAFSSTGNINRRNFCRAQLIIMAVVFVLYLIIVVVFGVVAFGMT